MLSEIVAFGQMTLGAMGRGMGLIGVIITVDGATIAILHQRIAGNMTVIRLALEQTDVIGKEMNGASHIVK